MAQASNIEWTDATWNPVRGCSRISPGCEQCYAEKIAMRFCGPGQPYEGFATRDRGWTRKVSLIEDKLDEPLRWRVARRIFVNSMSDLFHEELRFFEVARVFHTMTGEASACAPPEHIYQVLTKRAERMRAFFDWVENVDDGDEEFLIALRELYRSSIPPRVWLGVSVEDQKQANKRLPELALTPAAIRFISAEPLLGKVDLSPWLNRQEIDWVIVGGESGGRNVARNCLTSWIASIVMQCRAARIPVFVKQLGSSPMGSNLVGRLSDPKGGDWNEWPKELRVREFPLYRRGVAPGRFPL